MNNYISSLMELCKQPLEKANIIWTIGSPM